jgi:hypothetical protein
MVVIRKRLRGVKGVVTPVGKEIIDRGRGQALSFRQKRGAQSAVSTRPFMCGIQDRYETGRITPFLSRGLPASGGFIKWL